MFSVICRSMSSPWSADEGPSVSEVFGSECGEGLQEFRVGCALASGLFEHPDGNACARMVARRRRFRVIQFRERRLRGRGRPIAEACAFSPRFIPASRRLGFFQVTDHRWAPKGGIFGIISDSSLIVYPKLAGEAVFRASADLCHNVFCGKKLWVGGCVGLG